MPQYLSMRRFESKPSMRRFERKQAGRQGHSQKVSIGSPDLIAMISPRLCLSQSNPLITAMMTDNRVEIEFEEEELSC